MRPTTQRWHAAVSLVVLTAANTLAYVIDVRDDLMLGFSFILASTLLTVVFSVVTRMRSPKPAAGVVTVATITAITTGFLWRVPDGDGDGLWLLVFPIVGALVFVEMLVCWEIVQRRRQGTMR